MLSTWTMYLPPFLSSPFNLILLLIYSSELNICHTIYIIMFLFHVCTKAAVHPAQEVRSGPWVKYGQQDQSNYLCPSYLVLYWPLNEHCMNILPCSISRTGSCLHKEVNYDANNRVGVPGVHWGEEVRVSCGVASRQGGHIQEMLYKENEKNSDMSIWGEKDRKKERNMKKHITINVIFLKIHWPSQSVLYQSGEVSFKASKQAELFF